MVKACWHAFSSKSSFIKIHLQCTKFWNISSTDTNTHTHTQAQTARRSLSHNLLNKVGGRRIGLSCVRAIDRTADSTCWIGMRASSDVKKRGFSTRWRPSPQRSRREVATSSAGPGRRCGGAREPSNSRTSAAAIEIAIRLPRRWPALRQSHRRTTTTRRRQISEAKVRQVLVPPPLPPSWSQFSELRLSCWAVLCRPSSRFRSTHACCRRMLSGRRRRVDEVTLTIRRRRGSRSRAFRPRRWRQPTEVPNVDGWWAPAPETWRTRRARRRSEDRGWPASSVVSRRRLRRPTAAAPACTPPPSRPRRLRGFLAADGDDQRRQGPPPPRVATWPPPPSPQLAPNSSDHPNEIDDERRIDLQHDCQQD